MKTRPGGRRRAWWAAAAWWLACAPPAVAAECHLQRMEIPVRMVGARPVVTVGLNGTDFPLLLDSGAFFSMLTESTARQLNLPLRSLNGVRVEGYTGRIAARRTEVAKVSLNGVVLSDMEFIVGGNELGNGIAGLLGRNVLSATDTEYDLANGLLRMVLPKGDCRDAMLATWAGEAPVVVVPLASRAGDRSLQVDVLVNGRKVRAEMDTGAPHSTLKKSVALAAGVAEADLKPAGRTGGGGAGSAALWRAPVATFELGGEKVSGNLLYVDDADNLGVEMLLGLDYFLSHHIYVSRLQKKVYVTWNGGPVFSGNRPSAANAEPYAAPPAEVAADDADGLARRGQAAAARGDFARALEDLDRACALAPQAAPYFLARARVLGALGRAPAALQDLDRALQIDFDLHEARVLRVPLRDGRRDRAGALADLQLLDGALPASAGLRADMADHYARMDQPEQALRQWELWMPSHANDRRRVKVFNERCWLRTRLAQDLAAALEDCKASVALEDHNAHAHDSLGWTWLRLGEPERAARSFDRALELDGQQAWSHYGRGLARLRTGPADEAARDLAAARRLQPDIDEKVVKAGFEAAPRP